MIACTRKYKSQAPSSAGQTSSQSNQLCESSLRASQSRMTTTGSATTPRIGIAARFSADHCQSGWMGRSSRIEKTPWRISIVNSQTIHAPVISRTSSAQR